MEETEWRRVSINNVCVLQGKWNVRSTRRMTGNMFFHWEDTYLFTSGEIRENSVHCCRVDFFPPKFKAWKFVVGQLFQSPFIHNKPPPLLRLYSGYFLPVFPGRKGISTPKLLFLVSLLPRAWLSISLGMRAPCWTKPPIICTRSHQVRLLWLHPGSASSLENMELTQPCLS